MPEKEATARTKINKLLEAAGWRFFPEGDAPANIRLESTVAIRPGDLDALGEDFEKVERGFVGFLLRSALMQSFGPASRDSFEELYLRPALEAKLLEMTIPDKPQSRLQKYRLAEKGRVLLKQLNKTIKNHVGKEPRIENQN